MQYKLVIFGASGDLTSRKIIPALFRLFCNGTLPQPLEIIGVSRTTMTSQQWCERLKKSVQTYSPCSDFELKWDAFVPNITYFPGDVDSSMMFAELRQKLHENLSENDSCRIIFYLAVAPKLYTGIIRQLGLAGLTRETKNEKSGIIMEKPFGTNRSTANQLNQEVHQVCHENQIFRIDHFLGKETVNNIFALRFANTIFEPLWNRNYIDHIQITANESVLVGKRGAFYETTGILRDMFQNHLLQLLTITTMEPPSQFNADSVRDEKVKVLRSIRRMTVEEIAENTVFGQYEGYRQENGVAPLSQIPTFAAIRLYIDNWRWKNVPIYLRSGKGMECQTTQIVIQFKRPPHLIFGGQEHVFSMEDANRLVLQIQPSEGIYLSFLSKIPGSEMKLRSGQLTFSFNTNRTVPLPEAYERLLLDAFIGDSSLFARNDEVETAWDIIDPLENYRQEQVLSGTAVPIYSVGDWGPLESNRWMEKKGQHWFDCCPILNK